MNFPSYMAIAMVAVYAFIQTAAAQTQDVLVKPEVIHPESLFKGIIREDDVTLLFQYLRESMAAAARGEEARESEAMKRRTEQIQRDVAARGTVLMGVLLSVAESAAKQAIREAMSDLSSGNSRARPAPPSGATY